METRDMCAYYCKERKKEMEAADVGEKTQEQIKD